MTIINNAREFNLDFVQRLFGFQESFNDSFNSLLSISAITEFEHKELEEIRNLFRNYYASGKISEGQIKFLILAPLMKLAGFYHLNITITLEENIADIFIEDEGIIIKGRMDILAINQVQQLRQNTRLWILVIESKNSSLNAVEGLPQLLTYAYNSLKDQEYVWGLTTNGMDFQFVYIQQGSPPMYQLLPKLDLTRPQSSVQLLQVLKAIAI